MKKKLYIAIIILFAILFLSFSYSFATDNSTVVDGIRNVVGGAENTLENAGNGVMNGIKNVTSGAENMMENTTDTVGNTIRNAGNNMASGLTNDNTDYTATRTAANYDNTFLGMDPTMFTWLIMGIVGLSIIALVWVYARQNDHSYND